MGGSIAGEGTPDVFGAAGERGEVAVGGAWEDHDSKPEAHHGNFGGRRGVGCRGVEDGGELIRTPWYKAVGAAAEIFLLSIRRLFVYILSAESCKVFLASIGGVCMSVHEHGASLELGAACGMLSADLHIPLCRTRNCQCGTVVLRGFFFCVATP